MGVRPGQVSGVFKPVFDATKTKGGRRAGAVAGLPFPSVTWNPEVTASYSPNLVGAAGTDLSALPGWVKYGTTGTAKLDGSGNLTFNSTDGVGAAYAYDTSSTTRYIEARQITAGASNLTILAAVIDQNNWLGARYTSSGLIVSGKIGGAFITDTTVVGSGSLSLAPGWSTGSTLRAEVVNNATIVYYINGVPRFTGNYPSGLAGTTKVGLDARNSDIVTAYATEYTIGTGRINHGHNNLHMIGGANQTSRTLYANGYVFGGGSQWSQGDNGTPTYGKALVYSINVSSGAVVSYAVATGAGWGDGSHPTPSILVRPDGRLVATYTLHSDTTGVRFRISVNSYDVSAWSQEYVISGTGGTNGATYTNLFYMSSTGALYCFFRGTDLGCEFVSSTDILTVAAASADGGALGATPTWTALYNLIPLPSGSAKGVYTSLWSDGVSRIDIIANNAVNATGTDIDVRHAYYRVDTASLFTTADVSITPNAATTYGAMTAIATSAAPDNLGNVFTLDVNRRPSGLIEAIFYQIVSASDHRYFYATWTAGAWSKREIDAGTGGGTPDSRTPTIDVDNTGGSARVGGAAIDFNNVGLIYVSVGGHAQSDLYAYQTTNGGTSFTRTKVSPPGLPNPTGTARQVLSANIYPSTPRNAPTKLSVLWSRGRWDYYDVESGGVAGYVYALDTMSAGSDGTTLVP